MKTRVIIDLPNVPNIDIDSDDDEIIIRISKRYIRDRQDPFDYYSDMGFKKRSWLK